MYCAEYILSASTVFNYCGKYSELCCYSSRETVIGAINGHVCMYVCHFQFY